MSRENEPPRRAASDLAGAVAGVAKRHESRFGAPRCRRNAAFLAELASILDRADAELAARGTACRACGRCCRFEEFGHRLYVTTGELALLSSAPPAEAPGPARCPYQVGSQCTSRPRRALGCRAFFCDAPAGGRPPEELYEALHGEIRRLHARYGVAYHYVELTAGLAELASWGG